jgi:hypothetical protein
VTFDETLEIFLKDVQVFTCMKLNQMQHAKNTIDLSILKRDYVNVSDRLDDCLQWTFRFCGNKTLNVL